MTTALVPRPDGHATPPPPATSGVLKIPLGEDPDVARFADYLHYSEQYRHIIGRALAKQAPTLWPDPLPDERTFYTRLLALVSVPAQAAIYRQVMERAIARRKPHWREVVAAPLRFIAQEAAGTPGADDDHVAVPRAGSNPAVTAAALQDGEPTARRLFATWRAPPNPAAWRQQVAVVQAAAAACLDAESDGARLRALQEAVAGLAALHDPGPTRRRTLSEGLISQLYTSLRWLSQQAPLPGLDAPPQVRALADELAARCQAPAGLWCRTLSAGELEHWFLALTQAMVILCAHAEEVAPTYVAASGPHASPDEMLARAQAWRTALERYAGTLQTLVTISEACCATLQRPPRAPKAWRLPPRTLGLAAEAAPPARPADPPPPEPPAPEPPAPETPASEPPAPEPPASETPPTPRRRARAGTDTLPAPVPAPAPAAGPPAPDTPGAAPRPRRGPPRPFAVPEVDAPDVRLAALLAGSRPDAPLSPAVGLAGVTALVRDDRLALAYCLAMSLERRGLSLVPAFAPPALRALACARLLRTPQDEVVAPLQSALAQLHQTFDQTAPRHQTAPRPWQRAFTLVCLAATLRPALIAPQVTGAWPLLQRLDLDIPRLEAVRQALSQASAAGAPLDAPTLKAAPATRPADLDGAQIRQAAQDWWAGARYRKLRFAAATKVWDAWLKPTGLVGRLLDAVVADREELLDEVQATVARLREEKAVAAALDEADRQRRDTAQTNPIVGPAVADVARQVRHALEVVAPWVTWRRRLAQADPAEQAAQRRQQGYAELRAGLASARAEVRQQGEQAASLPLHAALATLGAALADLEQLLDPAVPLPPALPWAQALGEPLLVLDSLHLDEDWAPVIGPDVVRYERELLDSAGQAPDWGAAYARARERGCHRRTARLIALIARTDDATAQRWRIERDKDLAAGRQQVAERAARLQAALATAREQGAGEDAALAELAARLTACRADPTDDLCLALEELEAVAQRLEQVRARQLAQARTTLTALPGVRRAATVQARIERLLAAGDLATAEEYAAHAEQGRPLPCAPPPAPTLGDFFPTFLDTVTAHGATARLTALPLPWGRTEDPLLTAWVLAKRQQRQPSLGAALTTLVAHLGFAAPAVRGPGAETDGPWRLTVAPLGDPAVCPLAAYGSRAQGVYRLVCVAAAVPLDGLFTQVQATVARAPAAEEAPLIVLYFGRLDTGKRREVARLARHHPPGFVLLDEWLAVFLAAQAPATRLAALFACTLPFMAAPPDVVGPGAVPVELFYGRQQAMAQLTDPQGPRLLYGGRQVGKTALLRELARRHHDPAQGQLVLWLDLDQAGLGRTRPPAALWAVIAAALPPGVVAPPVMAPTTAPPLGDWLEAAAARRLLLLLDAAEPFLAADAEQGAPVLGALLQAMDAHPRFKVVLCGRHPVRRLSREAAGALARLGPPLWLGPLLDDGEADAACQLVATPLRARGFTLDEDLINRVLAHTLYQPALLQEVLARLVRYLQDPRQKAYAAGGCPPYAITAADLDAVLNHPAWRLRRQDRLHGALEDDPRHRVLALLVATATAPAAAAPAVALAWLQREAPRCWPAGFAAPCGDLIPTLLEELVGMGVLHATGGGYALRSPTVRAVLGAPAGLAPELAAAVAHPPPAPDTAATYRRRLSADGPRSPLVAAQEAALLRPVSGVTLVTGCRLSGRDLLPAALQRAAGEPAAVRCYACADAAELAAWLANAPPTPPPAPGVHDLLLVDAALPWDAATLRRALALTARRAAASPTRRWVFVADPARLWSLGAPPARCEPLVLAPWPPAAVMHGWREAGLGRLDPPQVARLAARGGLYARPLATLAAAVGQDPVRWREVLAAWLAAPADAADVTDLMAVPPLWTVLTVLASYGEAASAADLRELEAGSDLATVARALACATQLGLVTPADAGQWRPGPGLARLLAV